MDEKITAKLNKMRIPYRINRILLIVFALLMFLPDLSPTRFIEQAGQAKVPDTASLFTGSISYSSMVDGLERAFDKGWLVESHYIIMFIASLVVLLGLLVAAVGGCMSVGNIRMKNVGNRFLLAGSIAMMVGTLGILGCYFLITGSANLEKIILTFPIGLPLFLGLAVLILISSIIIFVGTPRVSKEVPMEMESKYKLFLMLMPFLALVFAFSYLPLFSWRYAFFDYTAGGELTSENFVGFKWFTTLVQNKAYAERLFRVLRNTLVMSGLGIATSWVPMVFAIFLSEIKSTKFKRFVQTFTTIPNFISWVLVYAIAFAIFNVDGFVNTLMTNVTGDIYSVNYLQDPDFIWLKMLLWGMWKGTGWSAIIYISGIAGIDQQLYEAATVDGAGRFQKMWHVTLPGLLPTYVVMLVMSIAGILSNGMDQYLVFSNALNKDTIEVLDLYVYNMGIGNGSIPLSTVVGMTKSIISVILLFIANSISKAIRGNGVV